MVMSPFHKDASTALGKRKHFPAISRI